jgi:hypothetical protein
MSITLISTANKNHIKPSANIGTNLLNIKLENRNPMSLNLSKTWICPEVKLEVTEWVHGISYPKIVNKKLLVLSPKISSHKEQQPVALSIPRDPRSLDTVAHETQWGFLER